MGIYREKLKLQNGALDRGLKKIVIDTLPARISNKVTWRVTRSSVGNKLYGVRCGWYVGKNSDFSSVKAITPNGHIYFHSAEMADAATDMIRMYRNVDISTLPITAYIKIGSSAVRIFSSSYEFVSAFFAHWQGTSVIKNLIVVHSGMPSDVFMRERCAGGINSENSLSLTVRELFIQASNMDIEQKRVNQLRIDLTGQSLVNRSVVESRGIISSWRKVCETFGFKGGCTNNFKSRTITSLDIKNGRHYSNNININTSRQGFVETVGDKVTFLQDVGLEKVDLFAAAKIEQSKKLATNSKKSATNSKKRESKSSCADDYTVSGLYSNGDRDKANEKLNAKIADFSKTKMSRKGVKCSVTHFNSRNEVFVLQVFKEKNEIVASIPLKSISSAKKMVALLNKEFLCDQSPSFSSGVRAISQSVCHASGFGREELLLFIGNEEQANFFYDEWSSGLFSSSTATTYNSNFEGVIGMDVIENRANNVKCTVAVVSEAS